MAIKITFATNKGGTGKTTSTAMCAAILAEAGYRVLAIDFDSQGNLTRILTGNSIYKYSGRTIMEAIQDNNADPYIINCRDNLDLIPAEDRLAVFSRYIYTSKIQNPYATLKRLVEPLEGRYDYIFIDIGPSLGDESINAIVCADHIVIPVDGGDLAMDALIRFHEFASAVKKEGHTDADVLGIIFTMRDKRSKYERDVANGIRTAYGDAVFDTDIRRKVRLKEMSAIGINLADPSLEDYFSLVEEIIERTNTKGDNKQ